MSSDGRALPGPAGGAYKSYRLLSDPVEEIGIKTSSSSIAERPRCRVGYLWLKVEDSNWETIFTDGHYRQRRRKHFESGGINSGAKHVMDFLLLLVKLFRYRCYGWGTTGEYRWFRSNGGRTAGWPKISGIRGRPSPTILLLRKLG